VTSEGSTPAWLLESPADAFPLGCNGQRRRGGALEKTLDRVATVVRQAIASDEIAARSGLLQRLDPRLKLIGALAFLITVGLVRHLPVVAALYLPVLALAPASRIELRRFVKRVWLFVPLFTGVIVAPAAFSFVTSGEIVVPLGHWFGHEVGLSRQGLTSAGLVVCRVAVSISVVQLLTLTTTWPRLLAALRALFVPRLLVLVLAIAYRYLFVLLDAISEMTTARRARTVAGRGKGRGARRLASFSAGALFGKAHALGEEIHQAMLARGYRGEARTLERFSLRLADWIWLVACLAVAVIAVGGDRALGV
jgi:cobalt/nickel transport system permease protein